MARSIYAAIVVGALAMMFLMQIVITNAMAAVGS